MSRTLAALTTATLLSFSAGSAFAVDGHGNATNPSVSVPNTGGVSGGPNHRDDPRMKDAADTKQKGKPAQAAPHSESDGHSHGKK